MIREMDAVWRVISRQLELMLFTGPCTQRTAIRIASRVGHARLPSRTCIPPAMTGTATEIPTRSSSSARESVSDRAASIRASKYCCAFSAVLRA